MDQALPSLFRAMRINGDRPAICQINCCLGVRHGEPDANDVILDSNGFLHPGTGGLSVVPDDPHHLPRHRLPRELGGDGKHPLWVISSAAISEPLTYTPDGGAAPRHGQIEPTAPMLLEEYRDHVAGTQPLWEVHAQ